MGTYEVEVQAEGVNPDGSPDKRFWRWHDVTASSEKEALGLMDRSLRKMHEMTQPNGRGWSQYKQSKMKATLVNRPPVTIISRKGSLMAGPGERLVGLIGEEEAFFVEMLPGSEVVKSPEGFTSVVYNFKISAPPESKVNFLNERIVTDRPGMEEIKKLVRNAL